MISNNKISKHFNIYNSKIRNNIVKIGGIRLKMKGSTFLITGIAVLLLISIVIAVVPPPPVNQDLGLPDTAFGDFTEPECRDCHSSGLVDRHHLLLEEGYTCTQCHNVNEQGLEFTRDCVVCHESSPHHVTEAANNRICSECHGFIDDYNDGHEIPTYEPSLVTPDTSFTYESGSGDLKIGGCEACHEAGGDNINSNQATHHGTNISCDRCHEGEGMLDIRKCQDCHGVKSLHSIQVNYESGEAGYGHIADDWDCWGCHGWYDLYGAGTAGANVAMILSSELLVGSINDCDNIHPSIDIVTPNSVSVGGIVCITGNDFLSTTDGGDATVTVMLGENAVDPESVTDTEITITADVESGNYRVVVKKEYGCIFESNAVSLSVTSKSPTTLVIYNPE